MEVPPSPFSVIVGLIFFTTTPNLLPRLPCPALAGALCTLCFSCVFSGIGERHSQIGRKMKVKVIQSCPTLCDPMDSFSHVRLFATPWTTVVHGILQARILEWVAVPFSRDHPNPGIEPRSPTLHGDSLPAEATREAQEYWSG